MELRKNEELLLKSLRNSNFSHRKNSFGIIGSALAIVGFCMIIDREGWPWEGTFSYPLSVCIILGAIGTAKFMAEYSNLIKKLVKRIDELEGKQSSR